MTRRVDLERRGRRVAVALLFLAGSYGLAKLLAVLYVRFARLRVGKWNTPGYRFVDLIQIWSHVEVVRSGGRLYWPWPDFVPTVISSWGGVWHPYPLGRMPYPPILTPILSLFAPLGFPRLAVLWITLLLACMLVYCGTLHRLSGTKWLRWLFAILAIPLATEAIMDGNVDPILWVLAGLSIVWPRRSGVALTAAACVKPWAIWPLAVAWRREGSAILRDAAVTGATLSVVAATILGPVRFLRALLDWTRYMLPVVGQGFAWRKNLSVSWLFLRPFYHGGPLPYAARLWLGFAAIAGPLAVAYLARHRSVRLHMAATIGAGVLFSPVCWPEYLPILLLPIAVLIEERRTPGVDLEAHPTAPFAPAGGRS